MIDLIENTQLVTVAIPIGPSACGRSLSSGPHDGAVLAALAVSFGTVLVCPETQGRLRSAASAVGYASYSSETGWEAPPPFDPESSKENTRRPDSASAETRQRCSRGLRPLHWSDAIVNLIGPYAADDDCAL
jgi:hypothetical protein